MDDVVGAGGLLGGLGRVVIANVGVEGGDQHEGVVQVVAAFLPVGRDAHGAVVVKGADTVGSQHERPQQPSV